MTKKWLSLAAGFAALALMTPCALATESDWAYRQQRASERRYERFLRRQELAQRKADRSYEQAMRRLERAEQRRAYRDQRRIWRYRDSRVF
jgi:hypothetical protein